MIEIKNLFFAYNNLPPYTLNDINLTINNGEYISILGENGSGKSTLIKLILKLLSPSKGAITVSSRRIGYVPQKSDFINSDFPITVSELLNAYKKLLNLKNKNIVSTSLEMVNMLSHQNSLIGKLSGGQCQKIFIARALMGNPDLLILDEPSTGIDLISQEEIYSIIKNLNEEKKITVISIEHNLTAAMKNSSLIYHISDGKGHLCTPKTYVNEYLGSNNKVVPII
jgi:ABC-type Mn/Zn transport systems, ATPase component